MGRSTQSKPRAAKEHECEWKDAAMSLEAQAVEAAAKLAEATAKIAEATARIAANEKRLAELERMFDRKSEKSPKMPPIRKPAPKQEDINEKRKRLAAERESTMEVVTSTLAVKEEDKQCEACAAPTFVPTDECKTSVTIHFVRAHLRKHVTKLETLVCQCGKTTVSAEPPPQWSENTQYASSFVAHLVTQKCLAHMPIYRIETMFAHPGMPIPRSTMTDLFYRAATKLSRLGEVLMKAIREDYVVHIDETSINMTEQKKKSQMWGFVGTKLVRYVFDLTRGGHVPLEHMGKSAGVFVADDYSGYNQLEDKGNRVRCGCLAHVRRGFFEAGDVPEAETALALIQELYRVEHEAKRLNITGTAKHLDLRLAEAKPAFVALMRLAHAAAQEHGPKTLLGKAAQYAWTNLQHIKRFLEDARIPLDNNIAENALRSIALGRKNFLFVQSEEAAELLALLYSLTGSCVRSKVNPVDYLEDVLERIDDVKLPHLRELLPDRWVPRATAPPD
jgi:transposase